MGSIISIKETIQSLKFKQIKTGRPLSIDMMLKVSDCDYLVKHTDGKFSIIGRSGDINEDYAVSGYGNSDQSKSVLDGLVRMGVLTKNDVRDHVAHIKQNNTRRTEHEAKRNVIEGCLVLGIEVPDGAKNDAVD